MFGEVGEIISGVITVTGDKLHKDMLNIDGPFVFVDDRYSNLVEVKADYKIMYSVWDSDTTEAISDHSMDVAFNQEELVVKLQAIMNNLKILK